MAVLVKRRFAGHPDKNLAMESHGNNYHPGGKAWLRIELAYTIVYIAEVAIGATTVFEALLAGRGEARFCRSFAEEELTEIVVGAPEFLADGRLADSELGCNLLSVHLLGDLK